MDLTNLTALDAFAKALSGWKGEDDYPVKEDDRGALILAIGGIKEEIRASHLYVSNVEQGILDSFVLAAITGGKDVPDAYRVALQAMQARTQLLEQKIDTLMSEDPEEGSKEGEAAEDQDGDNG